MLVAGVAAAGASLMLASVMLALPLGFDTQGVGWRAAPLRAAVVAAGGVLATPLAWRADRGANVEIGDIALLSIAYGVAALGLRAAWRALRRRGR